MNQTTLIRLALAKTFLSKAQIALKQGNDDLSLAMTIVDMHDCIDNFIGVLASELEAERPAKDYLISRFAEVSKKYKEKYSETLPNQAEVNLLNEIRNGVKHNGVLPNTTQVIGLVSTLVGFCNTVSEKVFGIKLEDVSLVSQVKNSNKRALLESIEEDIRSEEYRRAMLRSSVALFKWHDSHAWNLSDFRLALATKAEQEEENVFPKRDGTRDDLMLLQYGIDPYLYHRFKNLVPEIGYDNLKDRKLIRKYPTLTWHEKNWTAENARFCLSFLTKLFLGQQRDYGGYHIIHKRQQEKVTFLKDSNVMVGLKEPKIVEYTKGQVLYGLVDGFINGKLTGYRNGADEKIELTEINTTTAHFEKYLIQIEDVSIETVAESYEDKDF